MSGQRKLSRRGGLTALLMVLFLITGTACQSNRQEAKPPVQPEKVTITFSAPETGTGTAKRVSDAFMRLHPNIVVKTTTLPPISSNVMHDDYINKLVSGDEDIDLFAMDVIWVEEFASAGWLAPLSPYFSKDELKHMMNVPLESAYSQGTMYALPWYSDAGVLFYRKDLLELIGKSPPRTWSELIEQSKLLQEKGLVEHGYLFQGNAYEGLTLNYLEHVWNNGGEFREHGGLWKLDSVESVEALSFMQRLLKEGISPREVLSIKESQSRQGFLQGKSAFLRSGPIVWGLSKGKESAVQGKIGIAPLPLGPHGKMAGAGLGGFSVGMNVRITEPRRSAAVAFLKFLISEEAQKHIALKDSRMPVTKAPYSDPEVLAFNPYYKELGSVLTNARFRPRVSHYSEISSILQIGLHDALMKGRNANEVIKALNKVIGQLPADSNFEIGNRAQ